MINKGQLADLLLEENSTAQHEDLMHETQEYIDTLLSREPLSIICSSDERAADWLDDLGCGRRLRGLRSRTSLPSSTLRAIVQAHRDP